MFHRKINLYLIKNIINRYDNQMDISIKTLLIQCKIQNLKFVIFSADGRMELFGTYIGVAHINVGIDWRIS